MFPDFIKQTIEIDKCCYFSTGIDESITCSKVRNFDFNGLELHVCKHFPCEKVKEINKKFGFNIS